MLAYALNGAVSVGELLASSTLYMAATRVVARLQGRGDLLPAGRPLDKEMLDIVMRAEPLDE